MNAMRSRRGMMSPECWKTVFAFILFSFTFATCRSEAPTSAATDDCRQSVGQSEHNVSLLESLLNDSTEYESGAFLLPDPISVNGTVDISVSASGFCLFNPPKVMLRLRLYRKINEHNFTMIPGVNSEVNVGPDCSDLILNENRTIGSVSDTRILTVTAETGYYLGVVFNTNECRNERCTFLPAMVERDQHHLLYLSNATSANSTIVRNSAIQLSVSIMADSEECGSTDDYLKIIIVVLAVATNALLIAFVTVVCLYNRFRSKVTVIAHATNSRLSTSLTKDGDETQESDRLNVYSVGSAEEDAQQTDTATHDTREVRGSGVYDYARDEESGFELAQKRPQLFSEGHYEFDSNDAPFWEPASAEDELKSQLLDCSLSHSIQYRLHRDRTQPSLQNTLDEIQQRVPRKKVFSKNNIQVSTVVGQGKLHILQQFSPSSLCFVLTHAITTPVYMHSFNGL
jgi:hypothetical protein